jgi:hypothetical protein
MGSICQSPLCRFCTIARQCWCAARTRGVPKLQDIYADLANAEPSGVDHVLLILGSSSDAFRIHFTRNLLHINNKYSCAITETK